MATHSIKTIWRENKTFSTNLDGHEILIDLSEEAGGNDKGPRPKKLLLIAATGCTGLDVVETLAKMRVDIKSFNIRIDAEMAEDYPKKYLSMKLVYEFTGNNMPTAKIERAVKLSFDKYCGVIAMYKDAVPVTYEIEYKEN